MSWKKVKLKQILKQYRIEHLVQNDIEYKQVTISKYDGVTFRGTKMGKEIGRKRQFQIDLKKYPNTLMFVRQGVQDGSIGIAPLEVDGCIATENMPMFSIEGINLEYLKFLLKSPYFYDELNKIQTTGSAQKSIHEREILEIEIPFPDIEEQAEIVKELSRKKDNSIEISTELTHQLSLVKKLRQQLLQDAVQGKLVEQNKKDEPASELLKKIKAEKEKLIAEKKLKKEKELPPIKPEEIPFEIPENWVWCRLGALRDIRYSLSYGVLVPGNDVPNGIPFIRVQDLDYADKNEVPVKHISPVIDKQYSKTRLVGGEILICVVGSIGKVALSSDSWIGANIARAVCRYMPNQNISRQYLFYCLTSPFIQNFFQDGKKSINPTLNVNVLETTLIPLPPLAEQTRIVQKLDELMQYCNELEASIKQSESLNSTLLQQVLREALRKEPVEV